MWNCKRGDLNMEIVVWTGKHRSLQTVGRILWQGEGVLHPAAGGCVVGGRLNQFSNQQSFQSWEQSGVRGFEDWGMHWWWWLDELEWWAGAGSAQSTCRSYLPCPACCPGRTTWAKWATIAQIFQILNMKFKKIIFCIFCTSLSFIMYKACIHLVKKLINLQKKSIKLKYAVQQ